MGKRVVFNVPEFEALQTEEVTMANGDVVWKDPKGGYMPKALIKKEERKREKVINDVVGRVYKLRSAMKAVKAKVFSMVDDFLDDMAKAKGLEKYESETASLINFQGNLKIEVDTADLMKFNENLNLAKQHINEFMDSRPSQDPVLKSILEQTFDTRTGKINRYMILRLRKYRIPDEPESWKRAMSLIDESMEVYVSRRYLRVKFRDPDNGKWTNLPLDWADM